MDLSPYIISENTAIIDAMGIIDKNGIGIVLVSKSESVVGTLTDGDIRRHILKGRALSARAAEAANYSFKFAKAGQNMAMAKKEISQQGLRVLPIVDEKMRLIDIVFPDIAHKTETKKLNMPVVIMAGGKGTRLYPYTKVLPKPLIPIGDITITERIMNEFLKYGCNDFNVIVNYKKNMIKAYFADENLNYNISFVDECEPLGTGGGLKLLEDKVSTTFFMTNCDIMVFENYADIIDCHKASKNLITMVCVTKQTVFPYGTVEINDKGTIMMLTEKPIFSALTNSGFYIVEPEVFKYIPSDVFIHITDIIQSCIDNGERIGVFPIHEEQWADMGQPNEMERMLKRFDI